MKRTPGLSLLIVSMLVAVLAWSPAMAREQTASNDKPAPKQDATGRSKIQIPGQGWSISFITPPLSESRERQQGDNYAFLAKAGRFNLSIFVEEPEKKGGSNQDCADYYWQLEQQNPAIAKDPPAKRTETAKWVRVIYQAVVKAGPMEVHQTNVNYYFSYRGKWVDVHLSAIQPGPEDEEVFKTFDSSLSYGP